MFSTGAQFLVERLTPAFLSWTCSTPISMPVSSLGLFVCVRLPVRAGGLQIRRGGARPMSRRSSVTVCARLQPGTALADQEPEGDGCRAGSDRNAPIDSVDGRLGRSQQCSDRSSIGRPCLAVSGARAGQASRHTHKAAPGTVRCCWADVAGSWLRLDMTAPTSSLEVGVVMSSVRSDSALRMLRFDLLLGIVEELLLACRVQLLDHSQDLCVNDAHVGSPLVG